MSRANFFNYVEISWICLILWLSLAALSEQQHNDLGQIDVPCISAKRLHNALFFSKQNFSYVGWWMRSRGWDVEYYSDSEDPLKNDGPFYGDLSEGNHKVDKKNTYDGHTLPRGRIFLYDIKRFCAFYVQNTTGTEQVRFNCFEFTRLDKEKFGLHSTRHGEVDKNAGHGEVDKNAVDDLLRNIAGYQGCFVDIRNCGLLKDTNGNFIQGKLDDKYSGTSDIGTKLRDLCIERKDACTNGNCVFDQKMRDVYPTEDETAEKYQFKSQTALFCNVFKVKELGQPKEVRIDQSGVSHETLEVTKKLVISKKRGGEIVSCIDVDAKSHPGQFYWKQFDESDDRCQYLPNFIDVKSAIEEELEEKEKIALENLPPCPDTFMTNTYVYVLIYAFGAVMTFVFGVMFCLGRVGRKRRLKNEKQKRLDLGVTTSCYTEASQATQLSQMTVVV